MRQGCNTRPLQAMSAASMLFIKDETTPFCLVRVREDDTDMTDHSCTGVPAYTFLGKFNTPKDAQVVLSAYLNKRYSTLIEKIQEGLVPGEVLNALLAHMLESEHRSREMYNTALDIIRRANPSGDVRDAFIRELQKLTSHPSQTTRPERLSSAPTVTSTVARPRTVQTTPTIRSADLNFIFKVMPSRLVQVVVYNIHTSTYENTKTPTICVYMLKRLITLIIKQSVEDVNDTTFQFTLPESMKIESKMTELQKDWERVTTASPHLCTYSVKFVVSVQD